MNFYVKQLGKNTRAPFMVEVATWDEAVKKAKRYAQRTGRVIVLRVLRGECSDDRQVSSSVRGHCVEVYEPDS